MNTLTVTTNNITRRLAAVAAIAIGIASACVTTAFATDNRAPETPTRLIVGEGYRVHFHAYAVGYQVYVSTETAPGVLSWVFKAPEAVLFDNDGNVVGIHYAGPTWKTSSGSFVEGARIDGVTVDPTAIPWLILAGVTPSGPGVLDGTTHIQRVNTVGGLAPSNAAGSQAGDELRVPYTADYYFYRKDN